MEPGIQDIEKRRRGGVPGSIAKQRRRFADDVPRRPQRDAGRGGLGNERFGLGMMGVGRIESRVEEGGVAEDPWWQGHDDLRPCGRTGVP
jgi:hypothetical protein